MRKGLIPICLGLGSVLAAQAPPGWNAQPVLGSAERGPWYGAGLWSADQHGPAATFVDSLGLGNGLTGNGVHLEGGFRTGHWDFAAKVMAYKDPAGTSQLSLYQGHATWRNRGWALGLEREPLVWGYGLNGGYLLGEAASPFPKIRVEAPMTALHFGRVPLGTWGFQVFVGRMADEKGFSSSLQNPLRQADLAKAGGIPQGALLNGYRLQAQFGANLEFYANYINLWGGTRNGQSMLDGYSLGDYLTSMFGLKDALAEASVDPHLGQTASAYKNKALSASNADLGFRLRLRRLETWTGADTAHVYLSRGSKNVWWNPGLFLRNPLRYGARDLKKDGTEFFEGRFTRIWNETGRYSSPNLASPNDTLGLLLTWQGLRFGLEFLDSANEPASGVRSFTHNIYLNGFYYQGDPLGNALGGEARTTTARLEADLSPRLTATTLAHCGTRPFRDQTDLWLTAHPGLTPVSDRFFGLQQTLKWRLDKAVTLGLGASYQRHGAVANVPGATANAFRYYADLSYRWPAAR